MYIQVSDEVRLVCMGNCKNEMLCVNNDSRTYEAYLQVQTFLVVHNLKMKFNKYCCQKPVNKFTRGSINISFYWKYRYYEKLL